MEIINVALQVKPGQQAAYEAFIAELVTNSAAEAGNVSYAHFKQLGSNDKYAIIEHWRDQAAIDAHNVTPHFQVFLDHINEYIVGEPDILRMSI